MSEAHHIIGDSSGYVVFQDEITGDACKLIPPPTENELNTLLRDLHPANWKDDGC